MEYKIVVWLLSRVSLVGVALLLSVQIALADVYLEIAFFPDGFFALKTYFVDGFLIILFIILFLYFGYFLRDFFHLIDCLNFVAGLI